MNTLNSLSRIVGQQLSLQQTKLVTAESCTGGFLAKIITDIPGCSAWFERGYIVYSEESKQALLAVKKETLITFGAVSEQTVTEMALGALLNSEANISIAITGIAGPGGATPTKPVGLVWIAWAKKDGVLVTKEYHFQGDREAVREQTVVAALTVLGDLLA